MKTITSQLLEILERSNCNRCGGMMVDDHFLGKSEGFDGRRCVQCGNVIDPVILTNRLRHPTQGGEEQDHQWNPAESNDFEDLPNGMKEEEAELSHL